MTSPENDRRFTHSVVPRPWLPEYSHLVPFRHLGVHVYTDVTILGAARLALGAVSFRRLPLHIRQEILQALSNDLNACTFILDGIHGLIQLESDLIPWVDCRGCHEADMEGIRVGNTVWKAAKAVA